VIVLESALKACSVTLLLALFLELLGVPPNYGTVFGVLFGAYLAQGLGL
jgi:hypothetical protein